MGRERAKKVVIRVKGGIGNQLFCYAAARRLSLANQAELVIDHVTSFAVDFQYQRQYSLNHFYIAARVATAAERMEPFGRYRRSLAKRLSLCVPFARRRYIEQRGIDFDARLLDLKVNGLLYLDGYWQGERYFRDWEPTIRADLRVIPPTDFLNQQLATQIRGCNSVALHVRWFEAPATHTTQQQVMAGYYRRAIAYAESILSVPHYFIFSDNPDAAQAALSLPVARSTCIKHNQGEENAYADLWLMSQCQHFILMISTFGWWGAWLADHKEKMVLFPGSDPRFDHLGWISL